MVRGGLPGCEQKEFKALPARPLPRYVRDLPEKWQIVDNQSQLDLPPPPRPVPFFRKSEAPPQPVPTPPARPKLLLAKEYYPSMNWDGIRAGLLLAKTTGVQSQVVVIEAGDAASVDAIVAGADLCLSLGLKPILKLR
jgi:hypothetical protein